MEFLSRHGQFEILPDVMSALCEHDWQGNVRELQNCMDRMAAMNGGVYFTSTICLPRFTTRDYANNVS